MKFCLVVLCLVLAQTFAKINDPEWDAFKARFNKRYVDENNEFRHYATYKARKAEILEHNQRYVEGKTSYYKGINQFSDMEYEEVKRVSMGFKVKQSKPLSDARTHVPNFSVGLPDEVDWRKKGIVTPVKDQGSCGSCWAFSVVGAIEGQHAKATKKLVSLSEQNLVDCTKDEGNFGCNGGWPYDSYEYVVRVSQGIDTEASYPYKGVDQSCNFSTSSIGARATAFAILTPGNESVLQEAVANVGPISVCIDASGDFMSYSGGVMDDQNCSSNFDLIDHCVLAVGYGKDAQTGKDYWLIKNSWGTSYGEEGYVRMSRNKKNQCAISTLASYPDVFPTIH